MPLSSKMKKNVKSMFRLLAKGDPLGIDLLERYVAVNKDHPVFEALLCTWVNYPTKASLLAGEELKQTCEKYPPSILVKAGVWSQDFYDRLNKVKREVDDLLALGSQKLE